MTYKGTKYTDLTRVYTRGDAATIITHGNPVYKVGHIYFYGNRGSAKLLASEAGMPLETMKEMPFAYTSHHFFHLLDN